MIDQVTIEISGVTATTNGERWECGEAWLRDTLELRACREEVEGYTPAPAVPMAMLAEQRLGAKIVSFREGEDDEPEGAVY